MRDRSPRWRQACRRAWARNTRRSQGRYTATTSAPRQCHHVPIGRCEGPDEDPNVRSCDDDSDGVLRRRPGTRAAAARSGVVRYRPRRPGQPRPVGTGPDPHRADSGGAPEPVAGGRCRPARARRGRQRRRGMGDRQQSVPVHLAFRSRPRRRRKPDLSRGGPDHAGADGGVVPQLLSGPRRPVSRWAGPSARRCPPSASTAAASTASPGCARTGADARGCTEASSTRGTRAMASGSNVGETGVPSPQRGPAAAYTGPTPGPTASHRGNACGGFTGRAHRGSTLQGAALSREVRIARTVSPGHWNDCCVSDLLGDAGHSRSGPPRELVTERRSIGRPGVPGARRRLARAGCSSSGEPRGQRAHGHLVRAAQ